MHREADAAIALDVISEVVVCRHRRNRRFLIWSRPVAYTVDIGSAGKVVAGDINIGGMIRVDIVLAAAGLVRWTPIVVDYIDLMSRFYVGAGTAPVLQDVVSEIIRSDNIDNLRLSAIDVFIVIVMQ